MTPDEEVIYNCALRYSLGRKTYVVGLIINHLKTKKFSDEALKVMIKDIKEADDYGMPMDKKAWMSLLEHFIKDFEKLK